MSISLHFFFLSLFLVNLVYAYELKQDSDQAFIIHYKNAELQKKKVLRNGLPYLELSIQDFQNTSPEGTPAVPHQTITLQVPDGKDVVAEVIENQPAQNEVLPYDVAFAERVLRHDGFVKFQKKNSKAYKKIYGNLRVEKFESDHFGKLRLERFKIYPVRYNAKNRELAYFPEFTIHFHYVPQKLSPTQTEKGNLLDSVYQLIIDNPGAKKSTFQSDTKKDLLIAHSSYQNVLQRLVNYKKKNGRTVKEIYITGKSSAEIKGLIDSEYNSSVPPSHTLLIGNPGQIPAFKGQSDNTWTDYNYQLLSGGSIPDISLGRIPVSTPEGLDIFIDKLISREQGSLNSNEILVTSGKDTSLGCPSNVAKVGDKIQAAGSHIHITKKLMTSVSSTDVITAYNQEPNIIVYDGHGNRSGMVEIPLVMGNLNLLKNNTFPIILDIACLNANWSSQASWRNFAESILLLNAHGASGIMASGGSGYGHDFFQTIGTLLAKANNNLTQLPETNAIGKIILAAKIQHEMEDRSYWNYYGDPASSVWRP